MYEELASAKRRVIGTKQALRALEQGEVKAIYVAADAEERIVRDLKVLARAKNVPVFTVGTMAELGRVCGIDVGAASAAVLD